MNIESFTKLLQFSISPIALISGAGLLLLSITNRLGRSIDRSRHLAFEAEKEGGKISESDLQQLRVLVRRSEFLRNSVFFMGFSIFLSAVMIIGLFMKLFLGWTSEGWVLTFLILSISSISIAMVFFLLDVSLALKALRVELQKHLK